VGGAQRGTNQIHKRMPWADKFWKPIKLRDRRVLNTLGEARAFIATLNARGFTAAYWRDAEEMLERASVSPSAKDDALATMLTALKLEGLI
jgi:hypothetical protein